MSLTRACLLASAATLLKCEIATATRIAGGDLSEVYRINLADGRTAILKGGANPVLEADMLRALRSAGVPTPEVVSVDERCLILQSLPNGGRLETAWSDLGSVIAKLHDTTGPSYGWSGDYAFGEIPIENAALPDWPRFWTERRLLVHVPHIDSPLARRVETLAGAIENYLPATPRASLLHGDLWSGNILVDGNRISGLIDPACYFGHCEVDLAMLGIFDQPSDQFFDAYGALDPGFEQRIAVYRLWPALVHLRLFGSGYLAMTDRLLSRIGH